MPFFFSSATPDLGILEGRLTAARAAALDELLAANLPTDVAALNAQNVLILADTVALLADVLVINQLLTPEIADILADVTGLAGAAMRGTDNAFLAANAGFQMSAYSYGPTALADGAFFVPPAQTLVTQAVLKDSTVDANNEFYWSDTLTNLISDAFSIDEINSKRGIPRVIYCDGTNVKIRNNTGAQQELQLRGLTLT